LYITRISDKEIHILIIDDDKDDHFFFTNALEGFKEAGFTAGKKIIITSVYNGIQGLNYLLKRDSFRDAVDTLPDFIVLDLHMPLMNGYEALITIKNHISLKNIPVFVLTSSERENKTQCMAAGCSGFFSKPLDEHELTAVIKKMLENIC
jgi:CheY-like chemotaxis protein